MNFIKCTDEKTKEMLIKQGFKFVGTETIKGEKVYLFTNPKNLKMSNKNVFQSNRLHF
ncbi:hypothetical protein ACV3Q3_12190 [Clostridium perfringens]|jgi:hypothetical protein|uniref:Uncharacterized protein n=1 Tax=Clostridium perfringens TaxID=1502 RepID=A0AAP7BWM8_CLOPF|nr:hypothetical protein [Clostridium perfringens]NGU31043.1 hypothetical protein [Clostridium perfringens]